MNTVVIVGRLTEDPKVVADGKVTKLSVASNTQFGGKERTFYANVTAFGKTGEFAAKYFEKGKLVHVVGRLETNKHDGKSYTDVIANELNFVGSKADSEGGASQGAEGASSSNDNSGDEDLPF